MVWFSDIIRAMKSSSKRLYCFLLPVMVVRTAASADNKTPLITRGCCRSTASNYQLRWRSPPKSRRGLSSRGRASLTVIVRPSSSELLSFSIAASASASFSYSTKPKPRERPLSRSVTTLALATVPQAAKCACRLSSVVAQARLPTKSFFTYISSYVTASVDLS